MAPGGRLTRLAYGAQFLALLSALLAGCATAGFSDSVYRDSQTAYRVGPLPANWRLFSLSGANVAFTDDRGGSIVVNSTCKDINDVPLDVLLNQTLFEVEHRNETSREEITLDGRAALEAKLTGTLDGVPVALDLVVLKKDNCTYDLELVTGPDAFAARQPEFQKFVAGFHQLSRGDHG